MLRKLMQLTNNYCRNQEEIKMDNTRKIIRSSIVSLIIVSFGLFMLCVSRAPRINSDNSALSQGGGTNSGDQDLLSLLDEAGNEMKLEEESDLFSDGIKAEPKEENNALTALLNEADNDLKSTTAPAEQSQEESMDELRKLLESDEKAKYTEQEPLDQPKELTFTEYSETDAQPSTETKIDDDQALANLKSQVSSLEQKLADRTQEFQKLQSELKGYDMQIAGLESRSSTSSGFTRDIRQAAYHPANAAIGEENLMNNHFGEPIGNFEIDYEEGQRLFQQHSYKRATHKFFQLLQANRNHPLADNCQYWIGECYFAQGNYYQAIVEFNKVAAFDAADKKDDAQIMLGLAFMRLGESQHAQTELNWLVNAFASSEYVSRAYRFLRQL
jgi:TolA-binding protein